MKKINIVWWAVGLFSGLWLVVNSGLESMRILGYIALLATIFSMSVSLVKYAKIDRKKELHNRAD